jgi:hypothetical protein
MYYNTAHMVMVWYDAPYGIVLCYQPYTVLIQQAQGANAAGFHDDTIIPQGEGIMPQS